MILHKKSWYSFLFLALLWGSSLVAQDTIANDNSKNAFLKDLDQRNWQIKVPLWVPGFTGNFAYVGISNLPEEDDKNIIGRLNGEIGVSFYLIGNIRFTPKNWLFEVDGFHTTLASNLKFENIDRFQFNATIEGTIIRGLAGYNVYETINPDNYFSLKLYPYGGLRYIDLHIYSENINVLDVKPSWFEPIVGVEIPINVKRWFFSAKIDVGGFGIDNHWSWHASGNAGYRFSKLFAMGLGWSVLDFNYDQEYNKQYLDLGIRLAGPVLSLQFQF